MSAPELLPCPFCGGLDARWYASGFVHRFRCRNCLAEGPIGRENVLSGGNVKETTRIRNMAAVQQWNRRADLCPTPPAIAPKVTAIVEAARLVFAHGVTWRDCTDREHQMPQWVADRLADALAAWEAQ